jgi:hypothetical protein
MINAIRLRLPDSLGTPMVTLEHQAATALALTLGPGRGRSFASIDNASKQRAARWPAEWPSRSRAACQSKMIGR